MFRENLSEKIGSEDKIAQQRISLIKIGQYL
jgi:hypothetical protein